MHPLSIKKLYYSISEVSEITQLKPYVLRYWENEFSELRPSKNRAGNRIYRSNDIELILLIKKLLYEEKFTIAGAKKRLKEGRSAEVKHNEPREIKAYQGNRNNQTESIIKDIRQDLLEIKNLLKRDNDRGVAQSG